MRESACDAITPAETPRRRAAVVAALVVAIAACSDSSPLDGINAPGIVAPRAQAWGSGCDRDVDGPVATYPLGLDDVIWLEVSDMARKEGDGYTPGGFTVIEVWRGEVPDALFVHNTQVAEFDRLIDDDARVVVGLDNSPGLARRPAAGRFVGIAADGSIGFTGACGEFATATLARIAAQYDYTSGEALLRAMIDDPAGPEASSLP